MWTRSNSALHDRQGQRYCHDCHATYQRNWRTEQRNVTVSVTIEPKHIDELAGLIQQCTEIGADTARWVTALILAGFCERTGIHYQSFEVPFNAPHEPAQASPVSNAKTR
jgi:hypothetical protein